MITVVADAYMYFNETKQHVRHFWFYILFADDVIHLVQELKKGEYATRC